MESINRSITVVGALAITTSNCTVMDSMFIGNSALNQKTDASGAVAVGACAHLSVSHTLFQDVYLSLPLAVSLAHCDHDSHRFSRRLLYSEPLQ